MKTSIRIILLAFLVVQIGTSCGSPAKVRYPPSRWLFDVDNQAVKKPKESYPYKYTDILRMQFFHQLMRLASYPKRTRLGLTSIGVAKKQEALNVTNFDEVPNSTWFTNRIGRYALSTADIVRGPDTVSGPQLTGIWLIKAAKTEGLSPGFLIQDERGDHYIIKYDPQGHPDMASGAEIISTKFFYASGYNVPENYIVEFDPQILQIADDATTKDRYGRSIPFEDKDLTDVLSRVAVNERGLYRVLASKFLEGEPLGPFAFLGRRGGDKNDRIPHEHRRELRGYQVFSAWLNHGDSRSANTLDMFIETEAEKGYVKHHLIDFGGTLGSAGVRSKGKKHLYDYRLNYGRALAALAMGGMYTPYWEKAESTDDPSVGFFESELFEPHKWKPTYPNPAFQSMTPRDSFWAAKIVMRFSDEAIRAIVEQAQYHKAETADYITKHLIIRRDKIGQYWFSQLNPLDKFVIAEEAGMDHIRFTDLAIKYGFANAKQTKYRYRWRAPNGEPIHPWLYTRNSEIPLDKEHLAALQAGKSYLLRIETKNGLNQSWSRAIDVIIKIDKELELLGLRRRY